jgi:bifunctional UDP-N-acetylglucosamine pyrophosphorylase/glucosamine-1-phosphate N-acetyltransferase
VTKEIRNTCGFAGLVLAGGRGKRFPSEHGHLHPKVLRHALGRPIVEYVLDALHGAGCDDVTLVIGYGANEVRRAVGDKVGYAMQHEQHGSGHAAKCAGDVYEGYQGALVVMCGDSPLFAAETVREMVEEHTRRGAAVTLASASLENPFGYGRILRDPDGAIRGVVEEKCANEEQKAIREVNGGAYCFDAGWLFGNIEEMALNDAHEYNLTDMVRVAVEQKRTVSAVACDPKELFGVNTPEQLAVVEEILKTRLDCAGNA